MYKVLFEIGSNKVIHGYKTAKAAKEICDAHNFANVGCKATYLGKK